MWCRATVLAIHAGLVVACAVFWYRADEQDRTFEALVAPVLAARPGSDEATAIQVMRVVHAYGARYRKDWFCGQYSAALMRSLRAAGFETRVLQMRVEGIWGQHIVVEVRLGGRWGVLDPLYGFAFHAPDGSLVSARELQRDWPRYAAQTPARYDPRLRYRAFRYTNWDRPGLRWLRPLAVAVFGEEAAATFSLNATLPNRPRAVAWALGVLWLAWLGPSIWLWRRASSAGAR